jgi:dipeptidyl aminopeptidase/acylaminoacyl peptidase
VITRRRLILLSLATPTLVYPAVSAAMALGLTRTRRMRPEDTPEAVGLEYEHVTFQSADGEVELSGWVIPAPEAVGGPRNTHAPWVVIVHGFGTHRGDPAAGALGFARDMHVQGFGLLMFDMRGCGESGGGGGSVGYHERADLLGALNFLESRGVSRSGIGVHGFSLGGTVALTTCAASGVAGAVVADSAFADLWDTIRANSKGFKRPTVWFHPGMDVLARWMFGINIEDVSPVRSVAGSRTPLLIIHGADDDMVPVEDARLIRDAAMSDDEGAPVAVNAASGARTVRGSLSPLSPGAARTVETWIAPGAGHVQAYHTHRDEYVRRVSDFFRRTLSPEA